MDMVDYATLLFANYTNAIVRELLAFTHLYALARLLVSNFF
jgi:hypothetical protein